MTEDEMVGWHHRLNGHDFEQAPGDSEGQGGLACCSPWGRIESDMTEQLNTSTTPIELQKSLEIKCHSPSHLSSWQQGKHFLNF